MRFPWSRKPAPPAGEITSQDPFDWPAGTVIGCPECSGPEFMVVRPAFRAKLVDGRMRAVEHGACVVCLACDTPYVIVPSRPGGILKRKRVAAGVELPRPAARPSGPAIIDGLAREMGMTGMREEP